MINIKGVKYYCKDDLSLIENYEEAINSPESWHCHHRLETELNLSRQELKERDLYFNRPASELIFLPNAEHTRLHITGKYKGENNPMYGECIKDHMTPEAYNQWLQNLKLPKETMTPEAYEQWRKNKSESMKGENNPMYGKIHPSTGKHRVYHEDGTWHMEK